MNKFIECVSDGINSTFEDMKLTDPYPNEHACRLVEPKKCERFRRINNEMQHEGKRIDVVYCLNTGKDSEIQVLRLPTSDWTEESARNYCKEKGGILFEPAKKKERE